MRMRYFMAALAAAFLAAAATTMAETAMAGTDSLDAAGKASSAAVIKCPGVGLYTNTIAADADSDGAPELITAFNNEVRCFDGDGKQLWMREFDYNVSLDIAGTLNKKPCAAVSGRSKDTVRLSVLDASSGKTIWQSDRKITAEYQGQYDGSGSVSAICDVNGDGRDEVVALASAGYAWKPRGVIVYDDEAKELWRLATGPCPSAVAAWKGKKGQCLLAFGSYSPGNGNRDNGTDDMTSYLFGVGADGKCWNVKTGTHFTGTNALLSDLDADGEDELYAFVGTAYDYRKDEGGVIRVGRDGKAMPAKFDHGASIISMASGKGFLYAADKDGNIMMLDPALKCVGTISVNRGKTPMVVNIVGVADYDGDGAEELLLYCYNRIQEGRNPRTDTGPKNIVTTSNLRYMFITPDLKKIKKEVGVDRELPSDAAFKVIDYRDAKSAPRPYFVLSDGIECHAD